jgi:hypothetical protein
MKLLKTIYIIFSVFLLFYVALPNPEFPESIPGSLQSTEPADVETSLRRAYYTDLSRQEVLNYYQNQFNKSSFMNILIPTYELSYPPEEAQTFIRDQTRSSFLKEIVHPFRESIYINGYQPEEPQNIIQIDGKIWEQKIIVKYIPSNVWVRFSIYSIALILFWVTFKELVNATAKINI